MPSVFSCFMRFALLLAVVLQSSCLPHLRQAEPQEPPPVWPSAPDQPRIAFVQIVAGPRDLFLSAGWLDRLRGALFGQDEQTLVRPMATLKLKDVLYVADPGSKSLHRFDLAGGRHSRIKGPQGRDLPSPVGLAAGRNGRIFLADSALGQVFALDAGQEEVWPLTAEGALAQPTGLAFDPAGGHLYVAETTAHAIRVLAEDGTVLRSFGSRGSGAGEFNFPTLLWWGGDNRLYVTDSLNFRIQILDGSGQMIRVFGRQGDGPGDLARPKGLATDRYGHIYVVDGLGHGVHVFDQEGRLLLDVGHQGDGRGEFWLPVGIFIGTDDSIYIADSFNKRVQVLRYVGGAA